MHTKYNTSCINSRNLGQFLCQQVQKYHMAVLSRQHKGAIITNVLCIVCAGDTNYGMCTAVLCIDDTDQRLYPICAVLFHSLDVGIKVPLVDLCCFCFVIQQ